MPAQLDLAWFDPQLGALQRRETEGAGAGLSRAIAERFGVDAILVRVAFVVLTFCGGLGLPLYAWGAALTTGPQGTRPIDQALPGFREWSPLGQKLTVVASTIAVVATVGSSIFPLPWPLGILALIVLALVRRRSGAATRPAPGAPYPAPHYDVALNPPPMDDQFLVEQWRRSIREAAGDHRAAVPARTLPALDLYAPDEPLPRPVGPQPKAGWWGGLAVLAAMALASVLAVAVFGLSGIHALAATTAVGGLGAVIFALVSRHRRIPRPVLVAVAVPLVVSGWLAAQTPTLAPLDAPDTYTVRVVADDAVVDLRGVDLSGYSRVRVDALLSDVDVILPGPVASVGVTTSWAAEVTDETAPLSADTEVLDLEVQISARLSDVTVKDQP